MDDKEEMELQERLVSVLRPLRSCRDLRRFPALSLLPAREQSVAVFVVSLADGKRWFQNGAPLASVLRQDANPSPGANSASRLRFDVDGPSSSEQDSPVSLGERSLFFTWQTVDDPNIRPFASTGVFSGELSPLEEEVVFISDGGGEDSKLVPHSTTSAGVENRTGAQLLSVVHIVPLTSTERLLLVWPSSRGQSLESAGILPAMEASVLGVRGGGLPSQWPQVE